MLIYKNLKKITWTTIRGWTMNDKERVENAIIPQLLINNIQWCIDMKPWMARHYKTPLDVLRRVRRECLGSQPSKSLRRGLDGAVNEIETYWAAVGLDTRVRSLLLVSLFDELEEDGILAPGSGKLGRVVSEMDVGLAGGWERSYKSLEADCTEEERKWGLDYGRDCNLAIKHWPVTREIAQQQGYF